MDAVRADSRRAGEPDSTDRLFRQPVHARVLHGRGRRFGRLPPDQDDAVRAPGPAAPDPSGQRPRGSGLPERADRGRRAGRDDLRHLGWRAGRRCVSGVLARLHAGSRLAADARAAKASACPASSSPKAGVCGSNRSPRSDATPSGLDWTVNLGEARRRIDDRCALQGNLDPMALFAPAEQIQTQARRVLDSLRAAAPCRRALRRARVQSRARNLAIHAAGGGADARRCGAPIQPKD